jgi:membrane-bound lytic murein transglycosylase B
VKVRGVPAILVGAGVAVVCAVNVAAAVAQPSDAGYRVPLVDPFAVSADGAPDVDGSGAAYWHPDAPPAAPAVQADSASAADEGSSGAAASGEGAAGGGSQSVAAGATPLSHEVAEPVRQLPRTLAQWVASVSSATGIPARAVRAYGDATLELAAEDPSCHLGWPTLAGIGWIESGHGTHGHATLGADGVPSIPIVGPALDGTNGTAAIHATAQSTQWHGDPVWDHAVGPMQFIPSTWARWGADGDGDGVANPQDIDDAALAAGRYLCAGSRDLSTWDGWHAAVLSYNHSEAYAQSVFARAQAYAGQAQR